MRKLYLFVFALFWLLLSVSFPCLSNEPVTLQLKWSHHFQFAGYYVAKELGYYQKAGLDVTLLEAKPGVDPNEAVFNGVAQYGIGTNDLLLARANKKPVVVLATIFQHSPFVLIANLSDAKQDISSLAGKKVMIEPHAHELLAYLKKAGLDIKKLNLVEHTFNLMDLVDGKVDAYSGYVTADLFLLDAKKIPYRAYYPKSLGIDFYGDNLFTTEAEIEQHPDRVDAFIEASLKGWSYALAHQNETIQMMIKHGYVAKEREVKLQYEAKVMSGLIEPDRIELGYMSSRRWQKIADSYTELGLLTQQPNLNKFLYYVDGNKKQTKLAFYLIGALISLLILGSIFSLVKHLKSRNKIKEMQDLIDRVFENSPNYVYIKEAKNLTFVRVNKAFSDLWGIDEKEFVGHTALASHVPEFEPNILDKELLISGKTATLEEEVETKQGMRIWHAKKVPLKNSRGEITHLLVMAEDITERKQVLEQLRRNEELWSHALESTGLGVWEWHIDTGFVNFSKNWLKMLGYAEGEVQVSYEGFASLVHPNDLADVEKMIKNYLTSDSTSYSSELRMKAKNGMWKWILTRGHVTARDVQNNPIRLVGTHTDIHTQKRAIFHEKWRNQVLELLVSNASLSQVLTTIELGVEAESAGAVHAIIFINSARDRVISIVSQSLCDELVDFISSASVIAHENSVMSNIFGDEIYINQNFNDGINAEDDQLKQQLLNAGFESCWAAPILTSDGEFIGSLVILHLFPCEPTTDDLKMITLSAQFTGLAVERKHASDTILTQASIDALTNLFNRRKFIEHLNLEVDKVKTKFALLFIDLDQFKEVNDTLGHHVGDDLLVKTAARIVESVRTQDTVARLGGDEFTVILRDIADIEQIKAMAQSIISVISQPYKMQAEQIFVSASIGITLYPQDGNIVSDLLKHADQAMYEAKKRGRNGYQFFSQALNEAALHKQQLVKELRQALVNQELALNFQPIVDLKTGKISKAEALLRWQHPVRGNVSPEEFISVAEEMGLVTNIGNWVFAEALKWKNFWYTQYAVDFKLAVNMSPAQLKELDKEQHTWLELLANSGLGGDHFVIEITEGLLLADDDQVTKALKSFHDAGFEIAIDDFGTGYSALSYLKKFDINIVKIDRSFVRDLSTDINDLALCEAITVMAHKLGLKVVAEGVETEVQKTLLVKAGCDDAQGYLFSKPLAAHEFEALLFGKNVKKLTKH